MGTCPDPACSGLSALFGSIWLPFGGRDFSEGPRPRGAAGAASAANGSGIGTTTPGMLRAASRHGVITAPGSLRSAAPAPGEPRRDGTARSDGSGRRGPSGQAVQGGAPRHAAPERRAARTRAAPLAAHLRSPRAAAGPAPPPRHRHPHG